MPKFRPSRLSEISRRNRQEIIKARLSRRELFRMGLITSSGYLVHKSGLSAWADGGCNPGECKPGCSPPTIAFVDPITFPPLLPERNPAVDPAFTFSPPGADGTNPSRQGRFSVSEQSYDYFETMARAGFDTPQFTATNGDIRETLATLWYHDHRVEHTAENVYKGLAGNEFIFNASAT